MRSITLRFITVLTFLQILLVKTNFAFTDTKDSIKENPARQLIMKVVEKAGSMDKLKALNNVEYRYTFINEATQQKDVSIERYIFDGELSYAEYETHEVFIMPGKSGKVIQKYDGDSTFVSLNDQPVYDRVNVGTASFVRRANFYWFAMSA